MKPYVYLIGWKNIDRYYIGSQYSKKCDPKNLFVSYFTSSKKVKQIREGVGSPDVILVLKTFNNAQSAREWEYKLLRRMKVTSDERFLNQHDKMTPCNTGRVYTLEQKINKSISSKKMWTSSEARKHLSDSMKRKCASPEYREKMSLTAKKYFNTPEYKASHSEVMKRVWEERKRNASRDLSSSDTLCRESGGVTFRSNRSC